MKIHRKFSGNSTISLQKKKIIDTIKDLQLAPYDYPLGDNARTVYGLMIQQKECLLHCHFSKKDLSEHDRRHCRQLIDKQSKPLIFIINTPLNENARKLFAENPQDLKIISFSNKEELPQILKNNLIV